MSPQDGTSAALGQTSLLEMAPRRPNPLRALGEHEVLEVIFERGPVTRPQIAERTRLSKATVSAVVARLERAGMIHARGPLHGRRGRSPVTYAVRDTAGFVLGIDIGAARVRAAAADIFGEVIALDEQPTSPQGDRGISRQVADLATRVADRARSTHERLLTIGIAAPGVVDQASRRVTSLAYNVSPDGVLDPQRAIRSRFAVPVLIDNDVNLAAVAESWRGAARGIPSFALIWVGAGVGLGLVIDGELVRGAHGAAGEIGYLPSSSDPFDERHRLHGGLEDEVGAAGILAAYATLSARGAPARPAGAPESAQHVIARAGAGDEAAQVVTDNVVGRLASAIASVLAVIDPQLVLLSGEIGSQPTLLAPVRRAVAELVPLSAEIELSTLGKDAPLQGAMAIALREARMQLFERSAIRGA
jgi:predicted NBD/HSP70 family sugar kinase